jgi:SsrA-binding protein
LGYENFCNEVKNFLIAIMKVFNKRASFDYTILETLEAGISLTGGEARSVRTGHINLTNSYVKIIDKEAYLINANIPIPGKLHYDATSTRKLLLHKGEILDFLVKSKSKKLTIVPIVIYTKKRLIKLEIGLAKSKKVFEKKEAKKKQDIKRDIEREISG